MFGFIKSAIDLTTDVVRVATAPIEVAIDLTRVATKPAAELSEEVKEEIKRLLK